MSKAPREFWVKATGYQDEACTSPNKAIDLTDPGEDRWIYTHIQTVNPGNNSVAMKTKWLKVREILDSEPDWQAIAREMAGALEAVCERHKTYGDDARKLGVSIGLNHVCECALSKFRAAVSEEEKS